MPTSATPPHQAADRNLLFGILALQMDFLSRDALIRAMHAWVLQKAKPLGQVLLEQGALSAQARDGLERIVELHVGAHGGDPEKSLTRLRLRPTRCKQEGSGRADAGYACASPFKPLCGWWALQGP